MNFNPDLFIDSYVNHGKKHLVKLSNAEQITTLLAAKKCIDGNLVIGICEGISLELDCGHMFAHMAIPLLTRENAKIACIAKKVEMPYYSLCGGYWWDKNNTVSRLSFIDWMIEQLKNDIICV